jgi:phosphatidylinositol glycan class W
MLTASRLGYLAIFLLGLDTGHYVLPLDPYFMYRRERASRAKPKLGKTAEVLGSLAICFWIGYGLTVPFGIGTSRRLVSNGCHSLRRAGLLTPPQANLPYVLWVGAFNLSFLLGYVGVHMTLVHGRVPEASHTPPLFAALNEHGLVVFLLVSAGPRSAHILRNLTDTPAGQGNVLTGLVNLSLRTLHMPTLPAMLVMLLYLASCCAAAVELQRRGWRLRL